MRRLCVLIILSAALAATAGGFPIMGARSMSMGGTGVASAADSSAVYWNPAMTAVKFENTFGMEIDLGFDVIQNLSPHITDFEDIDSMYNDFLSDVMEGADEWNAPLYVDRFKELYNDYKCILSDFDDNGVGANLSLGAGVFFNFQKMGGLNISLGITALSDSQFYSSEMDTSLLRTIPMEYLSRDAIRDELLAGGFSGTENELQTEIDTIITDVLNQLNTGDSVFDPGEYDEIYAFLVTSRGEISDSNLYGLENNNSEVVVNGILMNEFIVSLSKKFAAGPLALGVGGNIKVIKGYNYSGYISVDDFRDGSEDNMFTEKFNDPYEGQTLGIDVSAYAQITENLSAGLIVRNLIVGEIQWDEIEGYAPEGYTPPTEARIGAAFKPAGFLLLTADADLTKVDGDYTDVRNIGLGAEATVAFLKIRGGMMFTPGLSEKLENSDLILTGGLGLDFSIFKLDIGAMMAPGDAGFNFDEDEIPERVGVALSCGLKI